MVYIRTLLQRAYVERMDLKAVKLSAADEDLAALDVV